MNYQRVRISLASVAAALLFASATLAQPGGAARHADQAELEDQCRDLVDAFDEAVQLVPYSDDVAAAQRLRRTGASECFNQGGANVMSFGVEDLRAALQKLGPPPVEMSGAVAQDADLARAGDDGC